MVESSRVHCSVLTTCMEKSTNVDLRTLIYENLLNVAESGKRQANFVSRAGEPRGMHN